MALIDTSAEIKRHNSAVSLDLNPTSIKSFLDDAELNHIIPTIGRATFIAILTGKSTVEALSPQEGLLLLVQKAAVNFAIGYYVNSGAVSITDAGIAVVKNNSRLPASDKKLVALRKDCFEAAYNALEKAVDFLETYRNTFETYLNSDERKQNRSLFIVSSTDFQKSGVNVNNSAQIFSKLKTYINQVELDVIEPNLGTNLYGSLKEKFIANNLTDKENLLLKKLQRPLAYLSMAEAIPYQDVNISPEGYFEISESVGGISGNTENKNATPYE